MRGIRFRRLLQRALLIFAHSLAVFGAACGGTSLSEAPSDTSASAGARPEPHGGGASGSAGAEVGGSAATSGGGGDAAGSAGSGNAGAGAGAGGTAGASAGAGGAGGSGASAGSGGAFGGSGGDSGSAGMGLAGNAGVCHATPPVVCGGGPIALPRTCVAVGLALMGNPLPISTCRVMCESMFTSSCAISAVHDTSITVMCMTGCPAGNE
jgi:hypothetical protein